METTHRKDKPILIIWSSCKDICLVIYYHTLIKCCLALENISCKNMFLVIFHQLQGASEVKDRLATPFLLYIRSARDKLLVKSLVRVSFTLWWLRGSDEAWCTSCICVTWRKLVPSLSIGEY